MLNYRKFNMSYMQPCCQLSRNLRHNQFTFLSHRHEMIAISGQIYEEISKLPHYYI